VETSSDIIFSLPRRRRSLARRSSNIRRVDMHITKSICHNVDGERGVVYHVEFFDVPSSVIHHHHHHHHHHH
jgi:hypothetical protein